MYIKRSSLQNLRCSLFKNSGLNFQVSIILQCSKTIFYIYLIWQGNFLAESNFLTQIYLHCFLSSGITVSHLPLANFTRLLVSYDIQCVSATQLRTKSDNEKESANAKSQGSKKQINKINRSFKFSPNDLTNHFLKFQRQH